MSPYRRLALLCVVLVLPAGWVQAGETETMLETDSGYRTCVAGMISGFGNGLTETWCQTRYPLPSPFHFKCLEQLSSGFASELDRVACRNYFRTIAMRIEADASRR